MESNRVLQTPRHSKSQESRDIQAGLLCSSSYRLVALRCRKQPDADSLEATKHTRLIRSSV